MHRLFLLAAAAVPAVLLVACAGAPASSVTGPLTAVPVPTPRSVERVSTGSLFQPDQAATALFTTQRRPRAVGDTLKVDVAETLQANSRHKSSIQRENKVASKGPGAASDAVRGPLRSLLELDASASGSDAFEGRGEGESGYSLRTRLTATVVNVLANGNLVVAGERVLRLANGVSTLRFSGVVDPADVRGGNVVDSGDVVDARLEVLGSGELGDGARRSWLQRTLTDALRVW